MNIHPRPTRVTGDFFLEVRWPAMLGGHTETIGPVPAHRVGATLRDLRAPYPGDHWPSITVREVWNRA